MFSCGFTGHRKIPQTEIAILYQHVQAATNFPFSRAFSWKLPEGGSLSSRCVVF